LTRLLAQSGQFSLREIEPAVDRVLRDVAALARALRRLPPPAHLRRPAKLQQALREIPVVLGHLVAALAPRLAADGIAGPTFGPILGLQATLRAIDSPTSQAAATALTTALAPVTRDVLTLLPHAPMSDTERIAAAARLAERFPRPIHRTRWPRAQAALRQLVKLHDEAGLTPTEADELQRLVLTRLFEAVTAVAALPVTATRKVATTIQAELNRTVTEDLLGPGWRRANRELPVEALEDRELDPLAPRPVDQAELRLTAAAAFARARLTPREFEVLALRFTGLTFGEIGRALTPPITAATVRVMWNRACQKARGVP
jgi:DNA-binding CsgD family transcriptional regulator